MMIRLLVLLISLAIASPSWAQMAKTQHLCTTFTAASQLSDTFTPTGTVTTGNLVVFGGTLSSRTISSISGNQGTTLTQNGSDTAWGGGTVMLWKGIAAGADTSYTINYSGTLGDNAYVCFAEFSGASSDQSGSTANGATHAGVNGAHGSGSVTPPTASNVIVSFTGRGNDTWTEDSGFTQMVNDNYSSWAYLIQTAATAQSYDMTSTAAKDSGMRIGAFAGASSGAVTNFFRLRVNP